jgi:CDP-glucose 4,6-dehydratase
VAQRLLDEGRRVVALRRDVDPSSRFHSEGIDERCTLVLADLADYDALVRVLNEHDVTEVFHLAAQAIVGKANRSPLATWESNVRATWCLLEACRTLGTVRKVVVASSDKAYGEHAELPYREDFALQPRYPYDVSKACMDMIARSYAATYALPVAVTRLANVYGPGDLSWSRIVPDTARALARGQAPVIRSDGTPERDFLYVEDAVDAYLAVAASLDRSGFEGRAWNAGCGQPVAVIDLVKSLIEVSGQAVEPDVRGAGTPHGEIDRQYLDSTAIRSELGWQPRWELRDGLAITWEWYRRHLSG